MSYVATGGFHDKEQCVWKYTMDCRGKKKKGAATKPPIASGMEMCVRSETELDDGIGCRLARLSKSALRVMSTPTSIGTHSVGSWQVNIALSVFAGLITDLIF